MFIPDKVGHMFVADYYVDKGYKFTICTSARNLIHALCNDAGWKSTRWSFSRRNGETSKIKTWEHRTACKTASFERRKGGDH